MNNGSAINHLSDICHEANKKWWLDLNNPCRSCLENSNPSCPACHGYGYGKLIQRNVGELLMLCVSELAEAMEGHRKNLSDDKLPHRPQIEVELADCLIRIFDLAGGLELDLGGAFDEKMEYNAQRADHKIENRLKEGGKKY